jgi:hypothetical protein
MRRRRPYETKWPAQVPLSAPQQSTRPTRSPLKRAQPVRRKHSHMRGNGSRLPQRCRRRRISWRAVSSPALPLFSGPYYRLGNYLVDVYVNQIIPKILASGLKRSAIAHRWRWGAFDVGDQALMRGLDTALPRCVRGCPYLTSGVEQVGRIASAGNSPAVPRPAQPSRLRTCGLTDRQTGRGQSMC